MRRVALAMLALALAAPGGAAGAATDNRAGASSGISATHLTSGGIPRGAPLVLRTAPVAPGRFVIVWVQTFTSAGAAPVPTVSGGDLVWSRFATTPAATPRRLTGWMGRGAGAYGPLTITVPHAAGGIYWNVVRHDGAGRIVQVAQAQARLFESSGRVQLAPFSSPANATAAGWTWGSNYPCPPTPGPGFGLTGCQYQGGYLVHLASEFQGGPDQTVDLSWQGNGHWRVIAAELAA